VENVCFVGGCFGFGALADRIGHTRVQAIGAAALALAVLPLFVWLDRSRSLPVLILVLSGCGIMVASYTSVAPTVVSGLFPTRVRATGVSLVYNAAITIFGGFAPAILSWFTAAAAGSVFAPACYVALAAVTAIITIGFQRRRPAAREA
jgi:MHS family proline/betaine transporter-like MFS transporter